MNMTTIAPPVRRPRVSHTSRHPTFLYIGTPKAGSTWIYNALREHPEVFTSIAKDLQFFDCNYSRGWHWYLRHFERADSALAVGEISHQYYASRVAARRISAGLPEARLICCLREPGDFAISLMRWFHNHYAHRYGSTFSEMARHPHVTKLLAYKENLLPYYDLFPRDQILVVYYEDLKANPHKFVQELYQFIGVDLGYQPTVLNKRSNPTRPPRSRALSICAVALGHLLGRFGATNLVSAVRQSKVFDKIMYDTRRDEPSAYSAELDRLAKEIRLEVADNFDELSQLIAKPLPLEWLSAAGYTR